MVYLAEHPALAVLEVRVHLDLAFDLLPEDYVLVRVALLAGPPTALGAVPAAPTATGDAWLAAGERAMLRVPSVLVPRAHHRLLNPLHPAAAEARLLEVLPFAFARLWAAGGYVCPMPSAARRGGAGCSAGHARRGCSYAISSVYRG